MFDHSLRLLALATIAEMAILCESPEIYELHDKELFKYIEEFKSTKQEFILMGFLCNFSVQLGVDDDQRLFSCLIGQFLHPSRNQACEIKLSITD